MKTILFSIFAGWFCMQAQVSVPSDTRTVTGDFDGDGRSDIATLRIDNPSITIQFGNSDGTFRSVLSSVDPAFTYYVFHQAGTKLLVADFNGDLKTDLAVIGGPWQGFYSLLSLGDGTFRMFADSLPTFGAEAASMGSLAVTGDFNGDKRQDIALLGINGSLVLAMGNSDGTFTQVIGSIDPAFTYYVFHQAGTKLLVVDFNGDLKTDLAVIGGPWQGFYSLLSLGDGTFRMFADSLPTFGAEAASVGSLAVTGDFNGDKRQDIALLGINGSLVLAMGNSDGTFTQVIGSVDPAFTYYVFHQAGTKLLVADFNGDLKTDLAVIGGPWQGFYSLLSLGDGTFRMFADSLPTFGAEAASVGSLAVTGDFNGDKRQDIALVGINGSLVLAMGNSDGTFTQHLPPIAITSITLCGSSLPLIGHAFPNASSGYSVATYIQVPGLGWWTKPTWDTPTVALSKNGDFSIQVVTGGSDGKFAQAIAYLVPNSYFPPEANQSSSPPDLKYPSVSIMRYCQ